MGAKPLSPLASGSTSIPRVELVSFAETGELDPHPQQLVERLLLARSLLHADITLSPRLCAGATVAAHVIVLDDLDQVIFANERLITHGFRVDTYASPPSLCATIRSSHSEIDIRALIVALTIVVREVAEVDSDPIDTTVARCRTRELGER